MKRAAAYIAVGLLFYGLWRLKKQVDAAVGGMR